jgi:hypothetical protein
MVELIREQGGRVMAGLVATNRLARGLDMD